MRRITALGLAVAFVLATAAGCGGLKEGTPANPVIPPSGWKPTRGPGNLPGEQPSKGTSHGT